jgi:uncharacterized metal-binding protein
VSTGKVHAQVTLLIAAEFATATIVSLDVSNVQYVIGSLLGLVLHPDLDVDHGNVHSYKIVMKRLGRGVTYVGKVIWYPYRKSLRHGSMLSHFPIISTLGRIAYLFLFGIIIPYIVLTLLFHFDFWYEVEWWFWQTVSHYKIILGLMVPDLFHWLMDISTKEHKR